jgi:dephospho-CoA kinase
MEIQKLKTNHENKNKIINNIAFIGKFASGKTYFSDALKQKLEEKGITTYRFSIAQKIKDLAKDLFDMQKKDRRLLQLLGAKMREIDKDVWIKYLILNVKRNNLQPFIIDDVRFVNEYNLIKNSFPNFKVFKLVTEEEQRLKTYEKLYGRLPTQEEINDPTEIDIDNIPFDEIIINDYKKESCEKTIEKIIEKYF